MKELTNGQMESLVKGLEAELAFFRIASSALLVAVLLLAMSLFIILGHRA